MTETLAHVFREGSRPALLLVHPLGGDLTFWEPFVAALGGLRATLAPSLAGSDGPPRDARPATIDRHVDDLVALCDRLGLDRVVPVGCAIGAMTAAAFAARHPDRVAALVLTNAAPMTIPTARAMLAARSDAVEAGGMAAVLPGAVDRAFLDQPRDAAYRRFLDRFGAQDPIGYAAVVRGILDADVTADLAAIRCPTLVVAGGRDVLLPPERSVEVAALVPGARLETFDEIAHFVPYQAPDRLARLLAGWLESEADPAAR